MQISGLYFKPTELESLPMGPRNAFLKIILLKKVILIPIKVRELLSNVKLWHMGAERSLSDLWAHHFQILWLYVEIIWGDFKTLGAGGLNPHKCHQNLWVGGQDIYVLICFVFLSSPRDCNIQPSLRVTAADPPCNFTAGDTVAAHRGTEKN